MKYMCLGTELIINTFISFKLFFPELKDLCFAIDYNETHAEFTLREDSPTHSPTQSHLTTCLCIVTVIMPLAGLSRGRGLGTWAYGGVYYCNLRLLPI